MLCQMNVLNVNSFLNKISVQDRAKGKFICPKCSDFFTNSKSEFHDHFSRNHIDYNQISCVYCEMNYDLSNISCHIESHFEENRMSTNICYLCNRFSKMDCIESILDHLMFQHNNQLICPVCKIEYANNSEFIEHINKNINIVYHCTSESCQMKTNDKEEMDFHKGSSGHFADLCFEEHIFNCQSKNDRYKFNYFDSLSEFSSTSVDLISDDVNASVPEEKEINDSKSLEKSDHIIRLSCPDVFPKRVLKKLGPKVLIDLKEKLQSIDQFSVSVSLENSTRKYHCSKCDYFSYYSHADVRKHIFMNHCGISIVHVRACLRTVEFSNFTFPVSEPKELEKDPVEIKEVKTRYDKPARTVKKNTRNADFVEIADSDLSLVNDLADRELGEDMEESAIEEDSFDYIVKLQLMDKFFEREFKNIDSKLRNNIKTALNSVHQFSIGVTMVDDGKRYRCRQCTYVSKHNHADVRKHIFLVHLMVSSIYARKCLRATRFIHEPYQTAKQSGLSENKENLFPSQITESGNLTPQKPIDKRTKSYREYLQNEVLAGRTDIVQGKLPGLIENNKCQKLELPQKPIDKRTMAFKASLQITNSNNRIDINGNKSSLLTENNRQLKLEVPQKMFDKRKKSFTSSVFEQNQILKSELPQKSIDKGTESTKASLQNKNSTYKIGINKNQSSVSIAKRIRKNLKLELSKKSIERIKAFKASRQNENSTNKIESSLLVGTNRQLKLELPQKSIDKRTKAFKASLHNENSTNRIDIDKKESSSLVETNNQLELPQKSIDKRTKSFKASLQNEKKPGIDKNSLSVSTENQNGKTSKLKLSQNSVDKRQRKSGPEFTVDKISPKANIILMNYSGKAFDKFYRQKGIDFPVELKQQMERYKTYSMKYSTKNGVKSFECMDCSYISNYYIADIKKHIMARHCCVNQRYMKDCLKFCRTNSNLELLPDEEIIDLINREQKLKRETLLSLSDDEQSALTKAVVKQEIAKPTDPKSRLSLVSSNRKRKSTLFTDEIENKKAHYSRSTVEVESNQIVIDREISLHYSEPILRALCYIENVSHRYQEMKTKLQFYCQTTAKIGRNRNSNVFICSKCDWLTRESLSCVSQHILAEHTGIGASLLPIVEMSTKLSDLGTLMPDNEISQLGWDNKVILSNATANTTFIDLTDS